MKIFSVMILLSLAVFALTGCPGNATNSNGNTNHSNGSITMNSNLNTMNSNMDHSNMNMGNSMSGMTKGASEFMTEAAQGGMAEVELGRLAQSKAQSADVKNFGQKMVQDHSNANTELKALAAKKNVQLPNELDSKHKQLKDKLSGLSGAEFDKEYVNEMVEDHEKDVKEFQEQSENATDSDVKAFAAKTLPTLKTHLQMIKDIQSKMK